jgi:hypothetical protein
VRSYLEKNPSPKKKKKKMLVEWLKVKALSLNPSIGKKKRTPKTRVPYERLQIL